MSGKDAGRIQGLAERSMNTSIIPPSGAGQGDSTRGALPGGDRIVTDNDQREVQEKTDPALSESPEQAPG